MKNKDLLFRVKEEKIRTRSSDKERLTIVRDIKHQHFNTVEGIQLMICCFDSLSSSLYLHLLHHLAAKAVLFHKIQPNHQFKFASHLP